MVAVNRPTHLHAALLRLRHSLLGNSLLFCEFCSEETARTTCPAFCMLQTAVPLESFVSPTVPVPRILQLCKFVLSSLLQWRAERTRQRR